MTKSAFSMRQLVEAGVHFGHTTRRWNPKMQSYIFGSRNGIHILDLRKTAPLLENALKVMGDVAARGGRILFVGTKTQASQIIKEEAKKCGQYYINHRWLGGMLTNWKTVNQSIKRLDEMEETLQSPESLTKKEILKLQRAYDKLELAIGGIRDMGGLPDVLFVLDTNKESTAILEAKKLGIPVIAVVDTNSNPDNIDYVIPGNDDAIRAIKLYCELMASSILGGLQKGMSSAGIDIGESAEAPAEAVAEDAKEEAQEAAQETVKAANA